MGRILRILRWVLANGAQLEETLRDVRELLPPGDVRDRVDQLLGLLARL
jgi:hypothetical protein